MVVTSISSDSKKYVAGVRRKFVALLGVSISFENEKSFKNRYCEFFEKIKNKYDIKNPRIVFKSYDLKLIFNYKEFSNIAKNFIDEVVSDDMSINVVFSSFNTQKMPRITYLGKDIRTIDFLNKELHNYYAYIPIWKTLQYTNWIGVKLYMDHFNPKELTNAWEFIKNKQRKVYVIPKGDQCNPLISSADIILEYLEYVISKNKIKLDIKNIQNLLIKNLEIEKSFVNHVGTKDISEIVPKSNEKIPKKEDYIHPTVYVILEGVINKEKDWIEKASSIYDYLLWYAWYIEGGLKFISLDQDFKLIDKKDVLVYLGEKGKNIANYLSKVLDIVPPKNIIGLDDIIEMAKDYR